MMKIKYSQKTKDIIAYSKEEAIRLGNDILLPEHLFLGILRDGDNRTLDIIVSNGIDLNEIRETIESSIKTNDVLKNISSDEIPLTKTTERILQLIHLEAQNLKNDIINPEHILLAMFRENTNNINDIGYTVGNSTYRG